jgi:hypothetical protein
VEGQKRDDPAPEPGMLWAASGTGEATGSIAGRASLWMAFRRVAGLPLDLADDVPGLRGVVRLLR